jgi:23S rRNA (adenine2030-N6)-methyltransferase
MNYQHSYHAGCIADVFKHVVLIQLLKNLHKKPGAFTYFETHAGNAQYDLQDVPSQKTLEYQDGIETLWSDQETPDSLINDYLQIIHNLNPDKKLNIYPGSGLIASYFMREQDDAMLCELHPEVYKNLQNYFKRDEQVHVHHRNGYEALPALLPPKNNRGLVLIDPPYEITDEFQQLITVLEKMQLRWANGIYAIWFPIKKYEVILKFYSSLKNLNFNNILTSEFWIAEDTEENQLKGSGLVIINPPWQVDELLQESLPELARLLKISVDNPIRINWLLKK